MPATHDSALTLEQATEKHLSHLLRTASNRLEMLLTPDQPHHEDDAERLRIQRLDPEARIALQRESLRTIENVRAEFRRRASD